MIKLSKDIEVMIYPKRHYPFRTGTRMFLYLVIENEVSNDSVHLMSQLIRPYGGLEKLVLDTSNID